MATYYFMTFMLDKSDVCSLTSNNTNYAFGVGIFDI